MQIKTKNDVKVWQEIMSQANILGKSGESFELKPGKIVFDRFPDAIW